MDDTDAAEEEVHGSESIDKQLALLAYSLGGKERASKRGTIKGGNLTLVLAGWILIPHTMGPSKTKADIYRAEIKVSLSRRMIQALRESEVGVQRTKDFLV